MGVAAPVEAYDIDKWFVRAIGDAEGAFRPAVEPGAASGEIFIYGVGGLGGNARFTLDKSVTINSDVMGGVPVIAGTRVPVHFILDCLADGMTIETIVQHVPHISKERVVEALKWASEQLARPSR